MSALLKRMKKNSKIDGSESLSKSNYFVHDAMKTEIPTMNVAFNGSFEGGLTPGVLMMAGESRTFKTGFLVQLAKAFQNKHKDGVVLFYDSEFSPMEYWESAGIDMDKVLHTPITTIEEMKHDVANQINSLEKDDKVIILIDSIGGLASFKEANDAIEREDQPVDFTRAKALNSFFRIVTPQLNKLKISMVLINSFYDSMDKYGKRTYGGGKKVFLSCDDVWFISRSQEKDGKELLGYNFNINIDKSRTIKEGSKFPIQVTYADGIDRYSGLYELAKEAGFLQPAGAWVKVVDFETGELSENVRGKTIGAEFYDKLVKMPKFMDFVKHKYCLK